MDAGFTEDAERGAIATRQRGIRKKRQSQLFFEFGKRQPPDMTDPRERIFGAHLFARSISETVGGESRLPWSGFAVSNGGVENRYFGTGAGGRVAIGIKRIAAQTYWSRR